MALPIDIEDLLNKNRVESNRIEFKAGWNPDDIFRSICAFATDFEDTGGGYILVGVEQDDNGLAIRPVKGLPLESIDGIMKKMVNFEAKITPRYISKTSIEEIDGTHILVIWIPAGINRPYCVAENVTVKKSPQKFYVRSKASTIEARGEILDQVRELANKIPFDEKVNESATLRDISSILVYDYLKSVNSKLADNFSSRPLEAILDEMDLLSGPTEDRKLKNCALMMFCDHPEKFFPTTQVDIVIFPEGLVNNPDMMFEIPKITGPVPRMIKETLSYLRTNIIRKSISKPSDNERSSSDFNYPFQALEEAVVNALYRRNYQEREPVEITIEPSGIEILSHSGPDRSISDEDIRQASRLKTRKYRNRRLGDFLKELGLTEGRATGIPTIQKALRDNGSDAAVIKTDENRSYFLITIPCRKDPESVTSEATNNHSGGICPELKHALGSSFVQVESAIQQLINPNTGALEQILEQIFVQVWKKSKGTPAVLKWSEAVIMTLHLLNNTSISANELNLRLKFGATYDLKRKVINPLINLNLISMTLPDKPTSAIQAYCLTNKAEALFH